MRKRPDNLGSSAFFRKPRNTDRVPEGDTNLYQDGALISSIVSTLSNKANIDNPSFTTRINTPVVRAVDSSGLLLESNTGADVLRLGAGGGATATAYGGWNFDNATADTIAGFGGSKTLISLATATYPNLTELSYIKGVTSAVQTQLNAKQNTLVSGTNIKTINSNSLLGSGNIEINTLDNLDGGVANSVYGGTTAINGGNA